MTRALRGKMYLSLLVFLVAGLLCACSQTTTGAVPVPEQPSTPSAVSGQPAKPSGPPDRVDVVYFHKSNECACMAVVGENVKYTVDTFFKSELAGGKLTFKMPASDDKANASLVKKYDSPPTCLFINVVRGTDENIYPIDDIWSLIGDENRDAFIAFVRASIEKSLRGEM